MPKINKAKPNWHLNFDVSPDLTIRRDGRSYRKATAIAGVGETWSGKESRVWQRQKL